MMSKVHYIPKGYNSITPYLIIKGAAEAIEYYKKVFGATEVMRMPGPSGRIGHAELKIGDSNVMLADEFPEMDYRSPVTLGSSPVSMLLYVEDADSTVERAVANGEDPQAGSGPVLWRSHGLHQGPIWTSLEHCDSHRRCLPGTDERARQAGDKARLTTATDERN
jgi:uncharacterized glyoxalase superfamily protein PhnB